MYSNKDSIAISIRPDSRVSINITQMIVIIAACLSGAFVSGASYMKITQHIDDPNHPSAQDITAIKQRLAALEGKVFH
jgi:hypothetical protein